MPGLPGSGNKELDGRAHKGRDDEDLRPDTRWEFVTVLKVAFGH
jgi:hypothetical protein